MQDPLFSLPRIVTLTSANPLAFVFKVEAQGHAALHCAILGHR